MAVFQLFYVSRAAGALDSGSVLALVHDARDRNEALRITGCLLFSGHCFAQVLEGDRRDVQALAERIANDSRHGAVRVLHERTRGDREYAGWPMGFLHDVSVDDDLETLLVIPQRSSGVVADVMERMRPDPVMGALR
jgi:hypothetical protein